ncbi:MAG: hypothetical protein SFV32_11545 [Opitutaceae bacterium]|nr:hypothetical protein [Opitutaceae bacterium]
MNTMRRLLPLFAAASLLLAFLSGCSTPESRIAKQPELFASLQPGDQELVRQGKVAVGFTPDMVKLALGDADKVWVRTDAAGTNEVWSYTTYESDAGVYLYRGYYHRWHYRGDPLYPYYLTVPSRREREEIRLQFKDGRVSVVEQVKRG